MKNILIPPLTINAIEQNATHFQVNEDKDPFPQISWQYTYVVSSQPESLEIPGSDHRLLLHVLAEVKEGSKDHVPGNDDDDDEAGLVKGVRIPIKAQFLLDGRSTDELRFVEEEVRILHFDDCAYATVDENERAQIIGKKKRDKRRAK